MVGQIDAPDARYTGPRMSDALLKEYLTAAKLNATSEYLDQFKQMTVWCCKGDTPEIIDQIDTVDAAGYQSSFWVELQSGK